MNDAKESRVFRASRFWESNLIGAAIGGFGGGILMVIVAIIILIDSPPEAHVVWGLLILMPVSGLLMLFPGNLIAYFPYAVEVDHKKGLTLFAPTKKIFIPSKDIREIRKSFWHVGFVVYLKTRRGLLTKFVVHYLYGEQRDHLVKAITELVNSKKNQVA